MERIFYLCRALDMKKLRKACNVRHCDQPPTREILVKEYDIRTRTRKTIVSLYCCSQHIKNIGSIIEELNTLSKGKIISTEVNLCGADTPRELV